MEVVIWNTQNAQIRIFKILSKMSKFESIKMILDTRMDGEQFIWINLDWKRMRMMDFGMKSSEE